MPGRSRTGSRPSRTVMSFAVYGGSAAVWDIGGRIRSSRLENKRKSLQNTGFAGSRRSYRRAWSERPLASPRATAFSTVFRRFSSPSGAGCGQPPRAPAPRRAPGRTDGPCAVSGPGSGPGANRTAVTSARAAISRARCASSKAHTESAVLTCSVPSRAIRAGHALRAMPSPTAAASARRPRPAPTAGRTATARPGRRQTAVPLLTSTTWPAGPGSAEAWVAVITVCPSSRTASARRPRRRASSSERTSSRRRIGGGERSDASARSSESTARRCSPWEPKPAELAPGGDDEVVQVRARCRWRRGRGRSRAALERRGGRRPRRRRSRVPPGEAEPRELQREPGLEGGSRPAGALPTSAPPRSAEALCPRRDRIDRAHTELGAAQGGVALRERRGVVLRHPGRGREQPG